MDTSVQSLKKRFEIYQKAKAEKEKRHVELGEGISVVEICLLLKVWKKQKKKLGANG